MKLVGPPHAVIFEAEGLVTVASRITAFFGLKRLQVCHGALSVMLGLGTEDWWQLLVRGELVMGLVFNRATLSTSNEDL